MGDTKKKDHYYQLVDPGASLQIKKGAYLTGKNVTKLDAESTLVVDALKIKLIKEVDAPEETKE